MYIHTVALVTCCHLCIMSNNSYNNNTLQALWIILKFAVKILFGVSCVTSSMLLFSWIAIDTDSHWYHGLTRICSVDRMKLGMFVSYKDRQRLLAEDNTTLRSVLHGGSYKPTASLYCEGDAQQIAIIVPYRDREENLAIFVAHMHSFLQKQQLQYTIFVIQQDAPSQFNRGLLFNAGFQVASARDNFTCYVFHDVDMLPENEQNLYTCHKHVRHMAVALSTHAYGTMYRKYFGGVVSFQPEQYLKINGCSNLYFGWGKEDDDLRNRVVSSGLRIVRPPASLGRYFCLLHKPQQRDTKNIVPRDDLKSTIKSRQSSDGLNSARYELLGVERRPLYTWVRVRLNEEDIMQRYKRCVQHGWPCDM